MQPKNFKKNQQTIGSKPTRQRIIEFDSPRTRSYPHQPGREISVTGELIILKEVDSAARNKPPRVAHRGDPPRSKTTVTVVSPAKKEAAS